MAEPIILQNPACAKAKPFALVMLRRVSAARVSLGLLSLERHYTQPPFTVHVMTSEFKDRARITGGGGIIVCHTGTDTINYNKRFFAISGREIIVPPAVVDPAQPNPDARVRGYLLVDDGKYSIIYAGGPIFEDPAAYGYRVTPLTPQGFTPIGEPETSSGMDAKMISGGTVRYITGQSVESEQWFSAIELTVSIPGIPQVVYRSLLFSGSTFWSPLACRPRAYGAAYMKDGAGNLGLTTAHGKIGGAFGNVIRLDTVTSENFSDSIPSVKRVYFSPVPKDGGPVRQYIETGQSGAIAALGPIRGTQQLRAVRGIEHDYSGSDFVNPFTAETYNIDGVTPVIDGGDYHRAATPGADVWMTSGFSVSGRARYSDGSGRILTTGYATIANDIKLPYGVSARGLTYIHAQKDAEFLNHRVAVYCGDKLIDESSAALAPTLFIYADRNLAGTISLTNGSDQVSGASTAFLTDYAAGGFIQNGASVYGIASVESDTALTLSAPFSGSTVSGFQHYRIGEDGVLPLLVRPSNFRIIHVHTGAKFDAVIYAKTEYVSHEEVPLPYRKARVYPTGGSAFQYQMAQCVVTTLTTFWVGVNGKKTQIVDPATGVPIQCTTRESMLLARSTRMPTPLTEFTPIAGLDPVAVRRVQISNGFQGYPWSDIGYKPEWVDALGAATLQLTAQPAEAAVNATVTRVFTSEATDLFVGFDVFPQQWHHELQFITDNPTEIPDIPETNYLGAQFQEALFPPTCDTLYPAPKSRQWLLFSAGGALRRRITPPADNRVNGVALVQ